MDSFEITLFLEYLLLSGSAWLVIYLLTFKLTTVLLSERAKSRAAEIASYVTSSINAVVSCAAVPVALAHVFTSSTTWTEGWGVIFRNQGVHGPLFPDTRPFYYSFMGYVMYDGLSMTVFPLDEGRDWVAIGHHALYFSVTLFFLVTQRFPLLAMTLVVQEVSTPFLNTMWIMKILTKEKMKLFRVNAVVMTVLFGLFRVLLPGFVFAVMGTDVLRKKQTYTAIDWTVIALVCLGYVLQIYWFVKIIMGFLKHVKKINHHDEPEQVSLVSSDDNKDVAV